MHYRPWAIHENPLFPLFREQRNSRQIPANPVKSRTTPKSFRKYSLETASLWTASTTNQSASVRAGFGGFILIL